LWFFQYQGQLKPALRLVGDSRRAIGQRQGLAQDTALPERDQGLSESLLLIPPCSADNTVKGFRICRKIGARLIEVLNKLSKIEDLS
jgi:hypothetical protein